jgi:hypothetical protein
MNHENVIILGGAGIINIFLIGDKRAGASDKIIKGFNTEDSI